VLGRRDVGRVGAGAHVIVAADFDGADGAEPAGLQDRIAGLHQVRRAAPLRAHLDHSPVAARGRHHGPPLGHVDADRFLHPDVGAGLHGGNHRQRVPVVGGGHLYDVELFRLEHLAIVAVGPRGLAGRLPRGHDSGCLGEHVPVHVAQRRHLHRLHLEEPQQVAFAVPAAADQAHAPRPAGGTLRGRRRYGKTRGGSGQEIAAIHG
jgi:hypothetical protein